MERLERPAQHAQERPKRFLGFFVRSQPIRAAAQEARILHEVEEHGATKLNIAASAAEIRAPWLIVHGSEDESVPLSEGERLSSLAGNSGEFLRLDGVNHSFGGKHPLAEMTPTLESVTRTTVAFFSRHLGAS